MNEEEEIQAKKNAAEEGYTSLSKFMKDLALQKNVLFKEKFFEMYKKVMEKDE